MGLKETPGLTRSLGMDLSYDRFANIPRAAIGREFAFPGTAASFPADLRAWMPASELARIVAAAIRHAERPPLQPGYIQRWELLLAWSVYAYAIGRCSSEEIAARFCPGIGDSHPLSFVDDAVIREFRRLNRGVLERTLAEILCAAHSFRQNASFGRWNASATTPDFVAEARARINRSAEYDCWSLDE